MTAQLASERRYSISFVFKHLYGSPPAGTWPGRADSLDGGIIAKISARLDIPLKSAQLVRSVLEDVVRAESEGRAYDADANLAHGAKPLLTLEQTEGQIAGRALAMGVGIAQATVEVNEYRENNNLEPVCWSAVQSFGARCPALDTKKRETTKSGKDDPEQAWSVARLAQAEQMKRQIALGEADEATRAHISRAVRCQRRCNSFPARISMTIYVGSYARRAGGRQAPSKRTRRARFDMSF
jgi:hypothetical protein